MIVPGPKDVCAALDLAEINPGMRRTVAWLRAQGFETTDSGDGFTNRATMGVDETLEYPHVAIDLDLDQDLEPYFLVQEALRLKVLLGFAGVHVQAQTLDPATPTIQATYDPADGSAVILLTGVNDAVLFPKETR